MITNARMGEVVPTKEEKEWQINIEITAFGNVGTVKEDAVKATQIPT